MSEERTKQTKFIEVGFKCPMCGKEHSLMIFEDDFNKYCEERSKGAHIQDIFPNMKPSDREKFITGYCDECQKEIFPDYAEDD